MQELFRTDNATLLLGISLGVAYLLKTYLTPSYLVHPLTLGKQSDVERVRQKGESPIYRNYGWSAGAGLSGQLPYRPDEEVKSAADLAKLDADRPARTLWTTKISNADLKARVHALGNGFIREAHLNSEESHVLLLLNDSLEFLIADLALASHSIPSSTISSLGLLSAVLDNHAPSVIICHLHFLSTVLELVAESHEASHLTIMVVGEGDLPDAIRKVQVKVVWLADLERKGAKGSPVVAKPVDPKTVFSVAFYSGPHNELKAASLTHMNMTAGVTAVRRQFPMVQMTPADVIISSHSLTTPYGRAVAYTALYEGASFSTSDSTAIFHEGEASRSAGDDIVKSEVLPDPTIFFLSNPELSLLSSAILSKAKESFLFGMAWRHKLYALQQGYLSNDSMWDTQVFASPRLAIFKQASKSLRAIVAAGGGAIEAAAMTPSRIALSMPLVFSHTHPLVAGPVFSSHPLDLQDFPPSKAKDVSAQEKAHVGPPSVNVEVKLVGVNDSAVEGGADPVGEIAIRGPSVATRLGSEVELDSWTPIGETATVQPNGTFKILSS